ncbi:hypothetical protein A3F08_01665 [Candidatus Berkelbacteria bacterium RIFCSPHIGHO2_12_FULL_36_9]|uniref:DUF4012 domain-containing protein n=1 Tax=Candidatus Berkelbacteria bacterium RIFCSPHIGHO2_12_FULL_36_9 TaxID=1797469 RepID=A0A1F5EEP4_9BACT|nr:MAG: hypothetical protein A3F08_01665 [Candidatus Berkelbacteria bacterium RIFCSPHIGHO2_12_FULL_36_9]
MSLDGIKVVKKTIPRSKNLRRADPVFWDFKKEEQSTTPKTDIKKELKTFLINNFTKRNIVAFLGSILIFAMLSVSASSYNLIRQNYDFLKLFINGKYLILFQNNSEMRATGGFIGSFAVIETKNGATSDQYFETNIYKRDNPYVKNHAVLPPDPVLKDFVPEGRWQMRDSNWAVDYPTAAQQIGWFYEQEVTPESQRAEINGLGSGKESIDGIIAINATAMADLLKIIGPINLPEHNTVLTSDNFLSTIQYKVEKEYFEDSPNKEKNRETNEPKTILKDMMPIVMEKIKDRKYYRQVLDLMKKELSEKQILFYFYDGAKEQIALNNGWAGEVKQTEGDYLYVNNSNLASNKSSLNTIEDLKLEVSVEDDGRTVNTLTITRSNKEDDIWPNGENINWVRVLVPYGAKIISAEMDKTGYLNHIHTKKEAGKTVFAFWMNTFPRYSHILKISYELPIKFTDNNYELYVQKQPGNLGDDLEVYVNGSIKFSGFLNVDRDVK